MKRQGINYNGVLCLSKQFVLKHIFCTTTLPCDCHVKFYDSLKQKKRLRDAL